MEFGPQRRTTPRYPFIRLTNDGIWQIAGKGDLDTSHDWTDKILIENEIHGGFTEEVYSLISKDRKLISELANIILEQNFPETMLEGPMLRHGIQQLHEQRIILPESKKLWPDQKRLEIRYDRFKEVG